MPVKKKTKKGGKKKDKSEVKSEIQPEISVLDKQYYLTQIQSLERNLDRINQRCEQLSSAEQHARTQYRNLHQEKNDIVGFLKERLKSKEDEIEELKNRLVGLMKAKQTEKEEYENRLKLLGEELERMKADLSDEILSLTRKLDSLEEFRIQKEKIDAEHIALTNLLQTERKEHKEKMADLEKSSIQEKDALIKKHDAMIIVLTEELREAARKEVHDTTRSALFESSAQLKSISTMRSKIIKLRHENIELRNNLREQLTREAILQDSLDQMTSISERKSSALRKVFQRVMEHTDVRKDYEKTKEETESLKRDLQQVQLQLDAATRVSCDIRESSSEKTIALDLLSAKLQEERSERRRVTEILHVALQMLQENLFSDTTQNTLNNEVLNLTLKKLVDILSEAEESITLPMDFGYTKEGKTERKIVKTDALATYKPGDLGLVPKDISTKKNNH